MRAVRNWTVVMLFVMATSFAAEQPQVKVPQEVKQAEVALTKWLGGFKEQTAEELRKSLGPPVMESSWSFQEKKEPVWKYEISAGTALHVYFHKDRVIKVGLFLIP